MPQTLHSCKLALDPQLHDDFFTILSSSPLSLSSIWYIAIIFFYDHVTLTSWFAMCDPKEVIERVDWQKILVTRKPSFCTRNTKKKHENRQINLLDENIKRKIHSTRVVVCASLANNLYTARLLFTICHSKGLDLSFSFVAASILLSIWETKSVCSADHHFAQKEEQGGSPQSHPSTQIWINSGQNVVSRYVWAY